jgi:hypothetical protein
LSIYCSSLCYPPLYCSFARTLTINNIYCSTHQIPDNINAYARFSMRLHRYVTILTLMNTCSRSPIATTSFVVISFLVPSSRHVILSIRRYLARPLLSSRSSTIVFSSASLPTAVPDNKDLCILYFGKNPVSGKKDSRSDFFNGQARIQPASQGPPSKNATGTTFPKPKQVVGELTAVGQNCQRSLDLNR